MLAECRPTSRLSSGRRAPKLLRAKQIVGLVAIELVLGDEVCGELDQILEKVVDKFSWPPHNLLFDSRVRLVLNCSAREAKCFRVVLVRPPLQRTDGPQPRSRPVLHSALLSTRCPIVIFCSLGISRIILC